jgi:glycerophosphoryl diester phosphodiesterase
MATINQLLEAEDGPLLIAHRGWSEDYPENTMEAFRAAVEAGCDAVEVDVRVTADGELICCHDEDLWRRIHFDSNPEAKGLRVGECRLKELRGLDVGGWKGPRFIGASMPTLGEVLEEISPRLPILVDQKSGSASQYLEVFRRYKAEDRVVLSSFDWAFLAQVETQAPDLHLAAGGDGPIHDEDFRRLQGRRFGIVNWQYYGLTRPDVNRLRSAGYKVWSWTINHDFEYLDACRMGISAVVTDRPDRLKRLRSKCAAEANLEKSAKGDASLSSRPVEG